MMKLLKIISIRESHSTNEKDKDKDSDNDNSIVYSIPGWDSTSIDFTYEFTSQRSLEAPDCLPRYFQPSGAADDARHIYVFDCF